MLFGFVMMTANAIAAPAQYAFRIRFTDKAGSPAISAAATYLSARSLLRRAAQHIALDSTDRPVSPVYISDVLSLTGGKFHNASRWLNDCVILLTDSTKILQLQGKPYIRDIAWVGFFVSGLHREAPHTNPKNESLVPLGPLQKTTGSAAYYGATWTGTDQVHGDYLHDRGFKGAGKLIAVLDGGFTGTDVHSGFDSLRQRNGIVETYNFVIDTSFVYSYDDHGMVCLSTMAGNVPGTFVGTAPDAQYALYVTEDGNFEDALYEMDNMVAGMERADSLGADVISSSLGYNTFVSPYTFSYTHADFDGKSTPVAMAANMAVGKGIFCVITAGNEDGSGWNFLLTPGDADSVLTVGAVGNTGLVAGYSSPGPNAAGQVKPDVCTLGDPAPVFTNPQGFGAASGTSFSTPEIAGWAACLWQANPSATTSQIRRAVQRSADRYAAPTAKYGYGIPDFRQAAASLSVVECNCTSPGIDVFPNPFTESVSIALIDYPVGTPAQFTVYDIMGRHILSQNGAAGNVILLQLPKSLPGGLYVLETVVGDKRYLNKIIRR